MEINMKDMLCELRRQKKVTQEAVAAHLGITSQSVGKWERGEGYPDITLLPALALYFGVTVDELLGVGKARQKERIDALIGMVFHLSRSAAKEKIEQEMVFAGGLPVKSISYIPREGESVSVRGYGKFIYRGAEGRTKKGRLVAKVERLL